jgi:ParB-like chromosome segregation protein Spo0J
MLWEIDENLMRGDLNGAERAQLLKRRKAVDEMKHPETKHGGDRGNQHTGGKKRQPVNFTTCQTTPSFVRDTAEKTGLSESAIEKSIHRADAIDPEVMEAIGDMPEIADKGVDALAAVGPEEQKAAVEAVKSGKARNVREATKGAKTRKRKRQSRPAPSEEEKLRREIAAAVRRYEGAAGSRVSAITITHNPAGILVAITGTRRLPMSQVLPISSILSAPCARRLNPERVAMLAASIQEIGLQTPISVRLIPYRSLGSRPVYHVVAGSRGAVRIQGCRA